MQAHIDRRHFIFRYTDVTYFSYTKTFLNFHIHKRYLIFDVSTRAEPSVESSASATATPFPAALAPVSADASPFAPLPSSFLWLAGADAAAADLPEDGGGFAGAWVEG